MLPTKTFDIELQDACLRLCRDEQQPELEPHYVPQHSLEQDIYEFPLRRDSLRVDQFKMEEESLGCKEESNQHPRRLRRRELYRRFCRRLRNNKRFSRYAEEYNSASTHLEIEVSVEPCNCSKTGCQKMYCECLARGKMCSEMCNCLECKNRQPNERLFRSARGIKSGKHDAGHTHRDRFRSSRYKDGCTCKKSHCLKKYCECYANGRKCGPGCICNDCMNSDSDQQSESSFKPRMVTRSKTRSTVRVTKAVLPNVPVPRFQEVKVEAPMFRFVLGDMVANTLNCRLLNECFISVKSEVKLEADPAIQFRQ